MGVIAAPVPLSAARSGPMSALNPSGPEGTDIAMSGRAGIRPIVVAIAFRLWIPVRDTSCLQSLPLIRQQ